MMQTGLCSGNAHATRQSSQGDATRLYIHERRLLVADGGYLLASQLTTADSLMPLSPLAKTDCKQSPTPNKLCAAQK